MDAKTGMQSPCLHTLCAKTSVRKRQGSAVLLMPAKPKKLSQYHYTCLFAFFS